MAAQHAADLYRQGDSLHVLRSAVQASRLPADHLRMARWIDLGRGRGCVALSKHLVLHVEQCGSLWELWWQVCGFDIPIAPAKLGGSWAVN